MTQGPRPSNPGVRVRIGARQASFLLCGLVVLACGCRIWPTERTFTDGSGPAQDAAADLPAGPDGPRADGPRSDPGAPDRAPSSTCGFMGKQGCTKDGWCRHDTVIPYFNAVWGSGPSTVFVVGPEGAVLRLGKSDWIKESRATTADLYGVWGTGPSDVYAVGTGGAVLHYDGKWWQKEKVPPSVQSRVLFSVWAAGPTAVFAVGEAGTLLGRTGGTWQAKTCPVQPDCSTINLRNVIGVGPKEVYAAGTYRTVLSYDGTTWTQRCHASEQTTHYAVVARGAGDALVLGDGGAVFTVTNNGLCPSRTGGSGQAVYAAWYDKTTDTYITVGLGGTIFKASGTKHTAMASGVTTDLYGVWGSSMNNLFAVGDKGVILRRCRP